VSAELELYTRRGCALCADLYAAAKPIARRYGVAIREVDIDGNPALREQYGWDVPVLLWRGREVCRHHLDAESLERALREG